MKASKSTARRRKRRPARPGGRSRRRAALPAPPRPVQDEGSGLAPGMQPISNYLAVANIAASMDFLEQAFGFSRGVVLADPQGQTRYAEMRHGTAVVVLVQKGDGTTATNGFPALYTYVDDVDHAAARARQAGAGVEEAEDKPWGDRVALVTDPDGYRWALATFKKLAPFT